MSEKQVLGNAFDAWEIYGGQMVEDENGRRTNRSSAYALVNRLPDEMKVKVGKSLRIHLPKLREWLDRGGDREAA